MFKARPIRRTGRRLLHAACFAMLRGATGSTVMTGVLLWLISR
ncbi:hypothetical protein [Streptomyces phaeochromogenes]|nr:hypothetical protein OHB08_00600 [Streptomyces phaeochromogenes]